MTDRHLLAAVLIGHPSGNQLPPLIDLDFELFNASRAKPSNNGEIPPSVKKVQGIVNGNFARIAGIIL